MHALRISLVMALGLVVAAACIRVIPVSTQSALTECCVDRKPPCPACQVCPDAGTPPDGGIVEPPRSVGWLRTQGNQILRANGQRWQGRGANLPDTRSCNACAYEPPNKAEVMRRADELIAWGATFIRLDLESYASSGGRVHWASVVQDDAYLQDIVAIVRHIGSKGVYTMVSLWIDPSIGAQGRPTATTATTWQILAQALLHEPFAIFGVVNEPESNYDGAQDAAVWQAMNDVVAAIRQVENTAETPHHLVAVQGTRGWARVLDYYLTHPITAGGGENVLYETHVYNPQSDFPSLVTTPAQTLPVIIGEFGVAEGFMTSGDTQALMNLADSLKVPWAAWVFHQRCPPNLLVENSGGGCGAGMALQPTSFGSQVKAALGGQ